MFSYRQLHDQCNTAATLLVALAELGMERIDPGRRGQELTIHGLIQRGPFLEGRGFLLAQALRYLSSRRIPYQVFHNAQRTAALHARLQPEPGAEPLPLVADLGSPAHRLFSPGFDLPEGALALLVETRPAAARLPLFLLLARRHENGFLVSNAETGENVFCTCQQLQDHLEAPLHFGALSFAARLYLHTGIVIRLEGKPAGGAFSALESPPRGL
jgi:hypothetical protein